MRSLLFAAISGVAALSSSYAQNLLQNGGFKSPPVVGRTPVTARGDPAAPQDATAWESLSGKRDETGGKLLVAITDEIARTASNRSTSISKSSPLPGKQRRSKAS